MQQNSLLAIFPGSFLGFGDENPHVAGRDVLLKTTFFDFLFPCSQAKVSSAKLITSEEIVARRAVLGCGFNDIDAISGVWLHSRVVRTDA